MHQFDLSSPYVVAAIILLIFISFYTIRELISDLIKTKKIVEQNKEIIELLTVIAKKGNNEKTPTSNNNGSSILH